MDELERRIRDANPSPVSRDTPLTERAERELATLLATPRERPVTGISPRRRITIIAATVAAAIAVLLTVGVMSFLAPRPGGRGRPAAARSHTAE